LSDFYHDDPVEEVSGTRRNFKGIISLILLIAVGGTYLQTTLAANINLNSGLVVEFGQGVAATTACSGSTSLIVTPISTFQNASGAGAFYFSSVKVSNIPSGCNGKDFIINAYNSSGGSPLAIFNSTSTSAVVWSDGGTFKLGAGTTTGASITSGSGTFTLTFTTPVAAAASVFKLTIQSSNHAQISGAYSVGDTGPGGGIIFYYSAEGFNCGPTHSATGSPTNGKCNYLEAAPSLWSGINDYEDDPPYTLIGPERDALFAWAKSAKISEFTNGTSDLPLPDENGLYVSEIGLGYKNSIAITTQNGAHSFNNNPAGRSYEYAAGAARAYSGGTKSDWYLPSFSELNLLCQWSKGVAQSATARCAGGGAPRQTGDGFDLLFSTDPDEYPAYSTSSSFDNAPTRGNSYIVQNMFSGSHEEVPKENSTHVRPIRAF